ncbi:helix-turn-helix domain-containing protein [Massilia soli]|uniref:Helix-turn-helix domain-containing protein n=1 Tax=Massilia soli TaxID=2792854 RepID=A0ABS7STQ0_9BURK|nr:helix-turn-helix transcriptional regulator [Massilia soli]MBZ2209323.1 helix-turn-helix domain-containing protein [Massilia soli]
MDPAVAFGRVLKAARKSAQLTQEQLALKAGVERNFVSLIERGINQPTVRVLFKLAQALDVLPSTLIEQTEREAADTL